MDVVDGAFSSDPVVRSGVHPWPMSACSTDPDNKQRSLRYSTSKVNNPTAPLRSRLRRGIISKTSARHDLQIRWAIVTSDSANVSSSFSHDVGDKRHVYVKVVRRSRVLHVVSNHQSNRLSRGLSTHVVLTL